MSGHCIFYVPLSFMVDHGPIRKDSNIIHHHKSARFIPIDSLDLLNLPSAMFQGNTSKVSVHDTTDLQLSKEVIVYPLTSFAIYNSAEFNQRLIFLCRLKISLILYYGISH